MKISFSDLSSSLPKAETLVFFVGDDKKFGSTLQALDKKAGGLVTQALKNSKFTGKKGQSLSVHVPASTGTPRVLLIGLGAAKDLKSLSFENAGGAVINPLNAQGAKSASVVIDVKFGKFTAVEATARMAYGAHLKSYRFDKYHTTKKPEEKPTLSALTFLVASSKSASAAYQPLSAIAEGVLLTRDLVSEPANVIYPATLAAACKTLAKLGVEVQVLGESEMKKLGMHALLGVGQGSEKESQLVIMKWNGGKKGTAPLAFVGKGVCFDTGGISIKPAGGMEEMKWDMGGAGAVIGLMRALAGRKAKVNAVGVVGLVENMPDGNAQRPGDVVVSMSGQTIEVLNTDAEGRLVLADALWYTQEKFKPRLVIDLATLTGAIIVALGSSRAGLFSNNDKLASQLFDAGQESGEEVWRLPIGDVYDKQINSDIADMQNIGADREAGSITAAQFLKRFIKGETPWAHLDIAGTAWTKKDHDTCPKGGTGYGVRLLERWVAENYEE